MGGSWDATNLIAGDVAVIGEVGLDHPELGSTVREVATEKAGIVKPGKIVVVREQPTDALDVIEARAKEMEATLLLEGRDWDAAARLPAVGGQEFRVEGVHDGLRGALPPDVRRARGARTWRRRSSRSSPCWGTRSTPTRPGRRSGRSGSRAASR